MASAADGLFMPKPLHMLKPDKDHSRLDCVAEAMKTLEGLGDDVPLTVVSLVGTQRGGKSTLLNLLYNRTLKDGFGLGHYMDPQTYGLWMWVRPHPRLPDQMVMYIDTEGLDAPHITPFYNWSLSALTLLISDIYCYQSKGSIDSSSVERLAMILRVAEQLRGHSGGGVGGGGESKLPGGGEEDTEGSFMWLLRDHQLHMKSSPREEMLEKLDASAMQTIKRCFGEYDCVTLPRPLQEDGKFKELDNMAYSDLTDTFKEEFVVLERRILERLRSPRKLGGHTVTGPMMAGLLRRYTEAIARQKGTLNDIAQLPTQREMLVRMAGDRAVKAGVQCYMEALHGGIAARGGLPLEVSELWVVHEEAETRALAVFRAEAVLDAAETDEYEGKLRRKLVQWDRQAKPRPFIHHDMPHHAAHHAGGAVPPPPPGGLPHGVSPGRADLEAAQYDGGVGGHGAHGAPHPPRPLPLLEQVEVLAGGQLERVVADNTVASSRACRASLDRLSEKVQARLALTMTALAAGGAGGGGGDDGADGGATQSGGEVFTRIEELDEALALISSTFLREGRHAHSLGSEEAKVAAAGASGGASGGGGGGGGKVAGGPMRKSVLASAMEQPQGWAVRGRVDLAIAMASSSVRDTLRSELGDGVQRVEAALAELKEAVAAERSAALEREAALATKMEDTAKRQAEATEERCGALEARMEAAAAQAEERAAKQAADLEALRGALTALVKEDVAQLRDACERSRADDRGAAAEALRAAVAASAEKQDGALRAATQGLQSALDAAVADTAAKAAAAASAATAALAAAVAEAEAREAAARREGDDAVKAAVEEGLRRVAGEVKAATDEKSKALEAALAAEQAAREAAVASAAEAAAKEQEREREARTAALGRFEEQVATQKEDAKEWRQRLGGEVRDLGEARRQSEAALEARIGERLTSAQAEAREAREAERHARGESVTALQATVAEFRGHLKDVEESVVLVQTQGEAKVEAARAAQAAALEAFQKEVATAKAATEASLQQLGEDVKAGAAAAKEQAAASTATAEQAAAEAQAGLAAATKDLEARLGAAMQAADDKQTAAREASAAEASKALGAQDDALRAHVADTTAAAAAEATKALAAGLEQVGARLETVAQAHQEGAAGTDAAVKQAMATAEEAVAALDARVVEQHNALAEKLEAHAAGHSEALAAVNAEVAAAKQGQAAAEQAAASRHSELEGGMEAKLQALAAEHGAAAEAAGRGAAAAQEAVVASETKLQKEIKAAVEEWGTRMSEESKALVDSHSAAHREQLEAHGKSAGEASQALASLQAWQQADGDRTAATRAAWEAALADHRKEQEAALQAAAKATEAAAATAAAAEAAAAEAARVASEGVETAGGLEGRLQDHHTTLQKQVGETVAAADAAAVSRVDGQMAELRQAIMNEVAQSFADATVKAEGLKADIEQTAATADKRHAAQEETTEATSKQIADLAAEVKVLVAEARSESADGKQQISAWRDDITQRVHALRADLEKTVSETCASISGELGGTQSRLNKIDESLQQALAAAGTLPTLQADNDVLRSDLTQLKEQQTNAVQKAELEAANAALQERVAKTETTVRKLRAAEAKALEGVRKDVEKQVTTAVTAMARDIDAAKENAASLWESLGVVSCRITDVQTQVDNFQ